MTNDTPYYGKKATILPPELGLAMGRRPDIEVIHKTGMNTDVDTTSVPEDIWGGSGLYTGFPVSTVEALSVVSTSASDAAAGVGARTVLVVGLDTNWVEQEETITLNGLTPVVGLLLFRRVNFVYVITAGSNTSNVGTITITHSTTTANVFTSIEPTSNIAHSSAYTVPAGKTAFMQQISGTVRKSAATSGSGFIWTRSFGGVPLSVLAFQVPPGSGYLLPLYGGIKFEEKTDLIVRVDTVSAINVEVVFNYDMVIVENPTA